MSLNSLGGVASNTTKVLVSFRDVMWRCLDDFVVLETIQRSNAITLFLKGEECDFCRDFMAWKLGKWREPGPIFIWKLVE